jgi:hypothetical protein
MCHNVIGDFAIICLYYEYCIWEKLSLNNTTQIKNDIFLITHKGPSWLYGSWIYNYLCSQCLLPLTLWVQIPLRWGVLDTTLHYVITFVSDLRKVSGFSLGTRVSSTNKTDYHNITEILLKVALNTVTLTLTFNYTEF